MFGYVLPDKPELKLREYEVYRAYYCAVCKSIGRRWGQSIRTVLSYDAAFLALLLDSVLDSDFYLKKERCILHPLKKRAVIGNNVWVEYASDMNVVLAYLNLKDSWEDEKSYLSKTAMIFLKKSYKKIKKIYPGKCKILESNLKNLLDLEKCKCRIVDEAAQPFALFMQQVMLPPYLPEDNALKRTLSWIGYNMGRWIYILDAFDDIERDIKSGAYNPLLYQYDYNGESVEDFKKKIKDRVEFGLVYSLSEMEKSYSLLELHKNKGILDNIFLLGMMKKTETILKGRDKEDEESI